MKILVAVHYIFMVEAIDIIMADVWRIIFLLVHVLALVVTRGLAKRLGEGILYIFAKNGDDTILNT
ncbi:hypothetical protein ABT56_18865 [Photobacterium aquae]|uniref:Uncharacterized protein n=1 Tax=Photobacterium aquae TaxID=1195763 RepID=A0A0J1GUU2_9GAMM|nr:hypothetical protein ABT56_18865 [Photobacterium aquae]